MAVPFCGSDLGSYKAIAKKGTTMEPKGKDHFSCAWEFRAKGTLMQRVYDGGEASAMRLDPRRGRRCEILGVLHSRRCTARARTSLM